MTVRFIHTADWQVGKAFRYVDTEVMALLKEARLKAISRLGEVARDNDIRHVLVAGDIYDIEEIGPVTLKQPVERMRACDNVIWHLLPGNHDPHRPVGGLWNRIRESGLPSNVRIYTESEPQAVDDLPMYIVPAPLFSKRSLSDPTEYMNSVDLPSDCIRVGLAHGSVERFGQSADQSANYIDPSRPESANLDYLALGDWHGQKKINSRCWYSGTPEVDGFGVQNGGQCLIVQIDSPGSVPRVTSVDTGQYAWIEISDRLSSRGDIDRLEERLRDQGSELSRILVRLKVEGTLSLEDKEYFRARIVDGVSAAFCHLEVQQGELTARPTEEDLNRIEMSGFVRTAAENLKDLTENGSESERSLAEEALEKLYLELMKTEREYS